MTAAMALMSDEPSSQDVNGVLQPLAYSFHDLSTSFIIRESWFPLI